MTIGAARTGVLQYARLTRVKVRSDWTGFLAWMRRYNEIPYVPCRGSDYCSTMRDDMTVSSLHYCKIQMLSSLFTLGYDLRYGTYKFSKSNPGAAVATLQDTSMKFP